MNLSDYHPHPGQLRPREKLLAHGPQGLSDLDLIQLLLGSGCRQVPLEALALRCRDLLDRHGPALDAESLSGIPGLGPAKAGQLSAALELARRLGRPAHLRVSGPSDLVPRLLHWADRPQEIFLTVTLNGAQEILDIRPVTVGLLNRTLIHPREVFAEALRERAASIVIGYSNIHYSIFLTYTFCMESRFLLIYCRVSTVKQEKKYSLPLQEREGREYAERHGFIPLLYAEARSGKDLINRKKWQEVETFIRSGQPCSLWVINLDRLNRNTVNSGNLKELLVEKKVLLIERTLELDLLNDNDSFMYDMKSAFSEYERRRTISRTKEIRIDLMDQGKTALSALYGYDKQIDENKKAFYTVNEAEAHFVKRIFEEVASGIPIRRVSINLLAEGFRGKNGGKIHHSNLSKFLRYPYYIGKTRSSSGVFVPSELFKNIPIITEELYEKVQFILDKRTKEDPRTNNFRKASYPLSGILECGECGQKYFYNYTISSKTNKKVHSYRHLIQDIAAKNCTNKPKYVMKSWLEAIVKKAFIDLIANQDLITNWFLKNRYQYQNEVLVIESQVESIKIQLETKQVEIQRLLDLAMSGVFQMDDIKSRRETLSSDITELSRKQKLYQNELNKYRIDEAAIAELMQRNIEDLYSKDESRVRSYYLDRIRRLSITDYTLRVETIYGVNYSFKFEKSYQQKIRWFRVDWQKKGQESEKADRLALSNALSLYKLVRDIV